MKKGMMTLIIFIIVMFSLFGCSIQDKNHGFNESKTETDELKDKNKIITALNNKHNQYNAYRICEENENAIQQLNLEGKPVHTFEITKGQKDITLLKIAYVTNEEILYILDKDDKFELWTIPLIQNSNKDEVQTEKKKLIFRTIDIIDVLYADTNYIAYKENLNYAEFNRTQQKKILINADSKKSSYCQPNSFNIRVVQSGNINDDGMILLAKNMGKNQYPKNIYVHKVGTEKVDKIVDTYTSKNCIINIVSFDDKIYYTGLIKNWRNEKQSWDIWCYDYKANRNYCVVQEKHIKDMVSFSRINALFINGNKIWVEIENEKCKFLYYPIVSGKNQQESTIEKATKLNQYIRSLKNRSMDITVLNINNNKCIIMESNASNFRFYSYDIKNEKECWKFDEDSTKNREYL